MENFFDTSLGLRGRAEHLLSKSRDEIRNMPVDDVAELVYELQVHQLELKMQNDELERLQEELRVSRQKYADLYEFAPIGYVTLDKMGAIIEANFLASLWLGCPRGELQGRKFQDFVAPECQDGCYNHYHDVFASGGKQTASLRLIGRQSMVVQANSQVNIPDDGYCCTTLTDITELV